MSDRAEARVTGSVVDRLVRIHPVPMSLDFRPAGDHALAHGWPVLRPGAPAPDLAQVETWRDRFLFVSDDGRIEATASGFNPVLGLRFQVPWSLVFDCPMGGAAVVETGGQAPTSLRH